MFAIKAYPTLEGSALKVLRSGRLQPHLQLGPTESYEERSFERPTPVVTDFLRAKY